MPTSSQQLQFKHFYDWKRTKWRDGFFIVTALLAIVEMFDDQQPHPKYDMHHSPSILLPLLDFEYLQWSAHSMTDWRPPGACNILPALLYFAIYIPVFLPLFFAHAALFLIISSKYIIESEAWRTHWLPLEIHCCERFWCHLFELADLTSCNFEILYNTEAATLDFSPRVFRSTFHNTDTTSFMHCSSST